MSDSVTKSEELRRKMADAFCEEKACAFYLGEEEFRMVLGSQTLFGYTEEVEKEGTRWGVRRKFHGCPIYLVDAQSHFGYQC